MKRSFAVILAVIMVIMVFPFEAAASADIGMAAGKGNIAVNSTKVAFAGHEWWVIGDDCEGVYTMTNHVTLLSSAGDFGMCAFRTSSSSAAEGFQYFYSEEGEGYFSKNPSGMPDWSRPSEYAGSTLQQKMESIADDIKERSLREYQMITARNLTSNDGILYQSIQNQKLWALSLQETSLLTELSNRTILSYKGDWWLRTWGGHKTAAKVWNTGSYNYIGDFIANRLYVRPSLSLNLSSVIFTSDASDETGKSLAKTGESLAMVSTPSDTVKFTAKDPSMTLKVLATTGQSTQTGSSLSFGYSDASTGENRYVSCILLDEGGNAVYYGKLCGIGDSSSQNGSVLIPLSGVADGDYTLKIFAEEANTASYTDFCSEPVSMKVSVSDGNGTVSSYSGDIVYTVSYEKNAHGTISGNTEPSPESETDFTAVPEKGYELNDENISVKTADGDEIPFVKSGNGYRFVMTASDVTVSAVFTEKTYGITYEGTIHGTVSGDTNKKYNGTAQFTAIPDSGYVFSGEGLSIKTPDGTDVPYTFKNGVYYFTMPYDNVTISGGKFIKKDSVNVTLEGITSENEENPETGASVSFMVAVPVMAALAAVTVKHR